MKIKCPSCSAVLNVPDSAAGKVVKCPCGKQLRAPGGAAPARPAAPVARPTRTPAPQTRQPAARGPASSHGGFDPDIFDELTDGDLQGVKPVARAGHPVAAPSNTGSKLLQQYASKRDAQAEGLLGPRITGEIAGVGARIGGALMDGVFITIFGAIGFGIMVMVGASGGEEGPSDAVARMALFIFVGCIFIPYLINMILISMSGQTVGKKIIGTVIVSQITGQPAGFIQGFLVRNVGFGFFTGLPIIGVFVALADCIYLFIEDHETLHDKLAKTHVVLKS